MRVWVASIVYYSYCYAVCEVLRLVVLYLVPKPRQSLTIQLLLEFVGTIQICAPMFDVGTVMENYGLFGVFIEITGLEIVNSFLLRDAIAHPCPIVTTCYRKSKAIRRAIYVFLVQITAAYLSYFVARQFWKFGIHQAHTELLHTSTCTADLTVALAVGYSTTQILVNCSFAGFLCVLGINFTGMYANPIVAWACTFNCEGVSHIGHLFVYWLAPLIGWYASEIVFGAEDSEVFCEEPTEPTKETKKEK
ncbi:unnamed protein product, partial [Mesorhabditis belari]|uniref:Aquaporin n=1 Tax=Mesorhabditis belari TaxID=2138241 RepID=A0AAF3EBK1_9BILA